MLKQQFLYVLLWLSFISTISYCQVIVTYDEDAKKFCVDIHKCDPCILGEEASQICYCRKDCNDVADESLIDCLATANGLLDIIKCKDLASQRVHFCKENCGAEPQWPYIDHIQMGLAIIVADIPFHPLTHEDAFALEKDGIAIDEEGYELNNFYKFDDNCLDFEDHDISGFNLCFTYNIRILIGVSGTADRRECVFEGEYCIIKG